MIKWSISDEEIILDYPVSPVEPQGSLSERETEGLESGGDAVMEAEIRVM